MDSSRTCLLLFHLLSFGTLQHPPFFPSMQLALVAELGHAVVLLLGAVVPQALEVVPAYGAVVLQVPTVVPLPWSGSTVASGQAQQQ